MCTVCLGSSKTAQDGVRTIARWLQAEITPFSSTSFFKGTSNLRKLQPLQLQYQGMATQAVWRKNTVSSVLPVHVASKSKEKEVSAGGHHLF